MLQSLGSLHIIGLKNSWSFLSLSLAHLQSLLRQEEHDLLGIHGAILTLRPKYERYRSFVNSVKVLDMSFLFSIYPQMIQKRSNEFDLQRLFHVIFNLNVDGSRIKVHI